MKTKDDQVVSTKSSTRTLILFCVVVTAVILFSLGIKIFLMVKNSKFEGSGGFIVLVQQADHKKAVFYGFDPTGGTFSQLTVTGSQPLANLNQTLSLPSDGELKKNTIHDAQEFPFEFSSASLYMQKQAKDISFIDAFRLWLFSKTVRDTMKRSDRLKLPANQETIDSIVDDVFIDSRLEKDKQTITITNGTTVSGLGGKLERVISRIGGNVISVTTSHSLLKESKIIYFGERTYTVDRLSQILPFPVEGREGNSVSDILIEIGENTKKTELF